MHKLKGSPNIPYEIDKWLDEVVECDNGGTIPKDKLYNLYEAHCRENAITPRPKNTFGKLVNKKYPEIKTRRMGPHGAQVICYGGITLKNKDRRSIEVPSTEPPPMASSSPHGTIRIAPFNPNLPSNDPFVDDQPIAITNDPLSPPPAISSSILTSKRKRDTTHTTTTTIPTTLKLCKNCLEEKKEKEEEEDEDEASIPPARVFCKRCDLHLCGKCDTLIHSHSAFKNHERQPLTTEPQLPTPQQPQHSLYPQPPRQQPQQLHQLQHPQQLQQPQQPHQLQQLQQPHQLQQQPQQPQQVQQPQQPQQIFGGDQSENSNDTSTVLLGRFLDNYPSTLNSSTNLPETNVGKLKEKDDRVQGEEEDATFSSSKTFIGEL